MGFGNRLCQSHRCPSTDRPRRYWRVSWTRFARDPSETGLRCGRLHTIAKSRPLMIVLQHLLLLAPYVSVSVAGLTLMKLRSELMDVVTWIGFVLYGAGFGLWLMFLKRVPLSKAFPVAAGCLIIATQVCGWYFLNEEINRTQMLGIGIMLVAVVLVFGA